MFKLKKLAEKKISETLNKDFSTIICNKKYLGIRPKTEEEFNYYLAGLIEGDGHIGKNRIDICFHEDEIELIEYIKKVLNIGEIKKKNKKAYTLNFNKKEEIKVIINNINGKLKTEYKYLQLENLIKIKKLDIKIKPLDNTSLKDNFWLSGFTDADGSLQLKVLKRIRKDRKNPNNVVKLNYQVSQKDITIINLLKKEFQGYIGTRKHINNKTSYYYESTSFINITQILNYLHKCNLQSNKYIRYLKFKDILNMYNKKEHLTEKGFNQILLLKKEFFETYKKEKVEK